MQTQFWYLCFQIFSNGTKIIDLHKTPFHFCRKNLGHSKIPNSQMGVYFESPKNAPFHSPNVV